MSKSRYAARALRMRNSLLARAATGFPGLATTVTRFVARGTSFANFGEDLVLDYYLDLPDRGFYVDVGANHPISHSNTFRLDLAGWHGVAVEPNPHMAPLFSRYRRNCTFVNKGVGATAATLMLHRFKASQWDTFDPEMAKAALRAGAQKIDDVPIAVVPLSAILGETVGDRSIDVLNVDVEGFDLAVLQSNDWDRWRPRVILIEDHVEQGAKFWTSRIATYLSEKSYDLVGRIGFTSLFVLSSDVNALVLRAES